MLSGQQSSRGKKTAQNKVPSERTSTNPEAHRCTSGWRLSAPLPGGQQQLGLQPDGQRSDAGGGVDHVAEEGEVCPARPGVAQESRGHRPASNPTGKHTRHASHSAQNRPHRTPGIRRDTSLNMYIFTISQARQKALVKAGRVLWLYPRITDQPQWPQNQLSWSKCWDADSIGGMRRGWGENATSISGGIRGKGPFTHFSSMKAGETGQMGGTV